MPSGISMYPRSCAISTASFIERPMKVSLRLYSKASSVTILIRCTDDEKQETKSRRRARENTSSNLGRTARSLGVYPRRSTLVES